MLEESEAALIVVGEATIEQGLDEAMGTPRRMKKEVRSDAREMERAIDAM